MRLPDGVSYHPRQPVLIARDAPALIRISTDGYPSNARYVIRERRLEDISPYLHGDWAEVHRRVGLDSKDVVYSGAEHPRPAPQDTPAGLKRPNITVVPNLRLAGSDRLGRPHTVFGCMMGHYH